MIFIVNDLPGDLGRLDEVGRSYFDDLLQVCVDVVVLTSEEVLHQRGKRHRLSRCVRFEGAWPQLEHLRKHGDRRKSVSMLYLRRRRLIRDRSYSLMETLLCKSNKWSGLIEKLTLKIVWFGSVGLPRSV